MRQPLQELTRVVNNIDAKLSREMYIHFISALNVSFLLINSVKINLRVLGGRNEEILAMWAVFEALNFRSRRIVFSLDSLWQRRQSPSSIYTFFSCCNSDYSLKFVPNTSRLYKYSQCLNMASRKLVMSKSAVKEVNYSKNWRTKHRLWENLFKCVCKQGLQNREDMAILHTLLVRRYVRLSST